VQLNLLVRVFPKYARPRGKENDPHIKPETPVLQIVQIKLEASLDRGVTAPTVNLRPTRDTDL